MKPKCTRFAPPNIGTWKSLARGASLADSNMGESIRSKRPILTFDDH